MFFTRFQIFIRIICIWILTSSLAISNLYGQMDEEDVLELEEESEDASELVEILDELRQHPIDLNRATVAELEVIPWITSELARAILTWRSQNGYFTAVAQITTISGFDPKLAETIAPFLTVDHTPVSTKFKITSRQRIIRKLEKSQSFVTKKYPGKAEKFFTRTEAELGRIQAGMVLESDPGEKKLNDYQAYFIQVDSLMGHCQLIAGRYQLELGQGLATWGPFGLSKSNHPIAPIKKRARGLRPYTSVDENAGLLGAGMAVHFRRWRSMLFYSDAALDATVDELGRVTALTTGGEHRTTGEIAKQDGVRERLMGLNLQYQSQNGSRCGIIHFQSFFSRFIVNDNPDRRQYAFSGKRNRVTSGYFDLLVPYANLFGEWARSGNNANAVMLGSSYSRGQIRLIMAWRWFAPDFQNSHAFAFGDVNGATQNETGFYTGIGWRPGRFLALNAYLDHYRHPWRTFFQPLPVSGRDLMVQFSVKISPRASVQLRYKNRNSDKIAHQPAPGGFELQQFQQNAKSSYRAQLDLRLSEFWHLRARAEWTQARIDGFAPTAGAGADAKGFLMACALHFNPKCGFRGRAGISFFDVDDFSARIFQYEPDLPGLMTNVMQQNRGTRWYFLLSYRIADSFDLVAKYSSLLYDDQDTIGTGPDLIESAVLHQVGIQFDWRF